MFATLHGCSWKMWGEEGSRRVNRFCRELRHAWEVRTQRSFSGGINGELSRAFGSKSLNKSLGRFNDDGTRDWS